MTELAVAHRDADAGDRRFIVSAWASSMRTTHAAGLISMEDWADIMHTQIGKVLDRSDCRTLVAYVPGEVDRIADLYGFLAFTPPEARSGTPRTATPCARR